MNSKLFSINLCTLAKILVRAKYPLATVEVLLDAFGSKIGGGYDIGCKFATTLKNSELGDRASKLQYTPLVGAFHGHAHNHICQLLHLATYVEGMGLEDLEGCERFFSKSNALASSVRYSSAFHHKQRIVEYIKHTDAFETSQNLSTSLLSMTSLQPPIDLRHISCQQLQTSMENHQFQWASTQASNG